MNPVAAQNRLERLQSFRQQKSRDLSITREIKHFVADVRRADRTMANLLTSWDANVPANLRASCTPSSLRGGVLVISCTSSAATYEMDRWLQSEGMTALTRSGIPVLRVRLVGASARSKSNGSDNRAKPATRPRP